MTYSKTDKRHYHFIGIGGIGMSALARLLLDQKMRVSGSDRVLSPNIDDLTKKGAVVQQGHSAKHISRDHTVVYSSGIKEGNPELMAAKALNCRLLHRSELLAELMGEHRTIVCAGTHGKTTTSSLLTTLFAKGGIDPTFAVGGMIEGINGKFGAGKWFVAEGDESDGTFLRYHPEGAIVTNIEPEHMDHYKSEENLHRAFKTFIGQVKNPDLLFYCGDDPVLTQLVEGRGVSYGFSSDCALQITNFRQERWLTFFDLHFEGKLYKEVAVALTGEHNALNAAAVFGLGLRVGLAEEKMRRALQTFPGIARRLEKRAERGGVLFLDDYAHHPTEITKTLAAVKGAIEERRLVVLFQPHRYSRTRDHFDAFAAAFESADLLFVDEVYSAGEVPIEGFEADRLIKRISELSTTPCKKWDGGAELTLRPHDVFLTLGAGNVTHVHDHLPHPKKLNVGLVFGGVSCEHEISVRSARFVASALDRTLYQVEYFGIDKQGSWVTGEEAKESLANSAVVSSTHARPLYDVMKELDSCDLFLPILHGTYGEDGTLQGLFEMLGKPYIGPDYRAAAITMDKVLTKKIVASSGVPVPHDISFGRIEWQRDKEGILKRIDSFPVYVKPVHLGSSVGISYIERVEQLEEAVEEAFRYDTLVMIEEGKQECRELEFAVVGNAHAYRVEVPPPGEKLAGGTFVDYTRKYSAQSVPTTTEPQLDSATLERGMAFAKRAYCAIGCTGMTRVDFLLDRKGEFWFFEMNPIPGMQELSLFPKIWRREGVEPAQLLDRLIILALQRRGQQDRHTRCLANC